MPANQTERRESRRYEHGENSWREWRSYYVLEQPKETAYQNADPPLPQRGSLLPDDSAIHGTPSAVLLVPFAQLRAVRTEALSGEANHSVVHLFWSTGLDETTVGGLRNTRWASTAGEITEPMHVDIDGKLIPLQAPATKPVAVKRLTATLEGSQETPLMDVFVNTVNLLLFRGWEPKTLLYKGPQTQLLSGHDTALLTGNGLARVSLVFLGRRDGWAHRVVKKYPKGHAQAGEVILEGNPPGPAFNEFTKFGTKNFELMWSGTGFSSGNVP